MKSLKSDLGEYIEKDMKNLKLVLEASMLNDKTLAEKSNFVLKLLEQDDVLLEKIDKVKELMNLPEKSTAWLNYMKN
jgi:hypothetical protein